jgi:signal transduction histidine kinase
MIAWVSLRHGTSPIARGGFARQMVNAHPDGVAVVAFSGEILSASDGLGRLLDQPANALEGRALSDVLDLPESDALRELRHTEAALRTNDGREIPVSVTSQILPDRRGLDFALLVVIRDLREVAALRSQLVTSGRLAAIGQLAAGIAHEINNPMAFVRTNLTLLGEHWQSLQKAPPSEEERARIFAEGEELLDESLEGVARACAIVRDINNFSHAGSGQREHVDVHSLLENVLRVAMPHLGAPVRLERDFEPVPTAWGASQELKQVFLNVLLNAAQALDSRGVLRISTRHDGDQVLVRVCDDGCGIPEEALDRVFDPFFTTKPVGEGTGMGLFISYQIVRNHGGELTVDSAPEEGTTVSVRLPTHPA